MAAILQKSTAARESGRFMRERRKAREGHSRARAQQAGNVVVADFDGKPFALATSVISNDVRDDPKLRRPVERARKVE